MFLPAELEAGRDGYNPFVIICTWDRDADKKAAKRLEGQYADQLKDLQGAIEEKDEAIKTFREQELEQVFMNSLLVKDSLIDTYINDQFIDNIIL